jgi:hypothetical protein
MANEKEDQEKILKNYVEQQEVPTITSPPIGSKPIESTDVKIPWQRSESDFAVGNQLGWIPLPIGDLPTQGLFYPLGTTISIRAANGGEIRHWSTLQEEDLSALDDMLNYIVERCVTIKSGNEESLRLSWKDIKEVDRFYLLLAIHELTFAEGENKLQVKVTDTKKLDVKKEMVNYVNLDPKLMRYYDDTERCFILKFKTGKILKLDLPSIGVTQWLKHYVIRKRNNQEYIDEDYLAYAPFIIRNWRGLNEDVYVQYIQESQKWDVNTISLLVQVKKLFADTINPIIKFVDEGGVEQAVPLNFQGGFKSLFLISDPFGQLE